MIDPKLFTVEALLDTFLDDSFGNVDAWRKFASIEKRMVRASACFHDQPKVEGWVVRYGKSFLRYSCGPGRSLVWDSYGDNFMSPALAFRRLLDAPVPPFICRPWPPDPDAAEKRSATPGEVDAALYLGPSSKDVP